MATQASVKIRGKEEDIVERWYCIGQALMRCAWHGCWAALGPRTMRAWHDEERDAWLATLGVCRDKGLYDRLLEPDDEEQEVSLRRP